MRKRFGMFTPAGDKLIYSMVATVKRMVKRGVTRAEAVEYLKKRWTAIERKPGHEEATDSEVRDTVLLELNGLFKRAYGKERGTVIDE